MPFAKYCPESKFEVARWMRKNKTFHEQLLWRKIRGKRLGFKFRAQQVILGYIADFWCLSGGFAVEVDGQSHSTDYGIHKDGLRDMAFKRKGILVLRFTNDEVRNQMPQVLRKIRRVWKERNQRQKT